MHAEVNEDMLKAFNKYFITLGRGIHMYIYIYMYGVMQSDRLLSHAQGADHQNSSSQQAVQDAREHVRALVLSNPANSCYLHSFVLSIMWTFTFVPGTVERPADISGGAVTEDWLSFCGVRSRSLAKIVSTTCWSGNLSFMIGGSLNNVDMMFRSSPHMFCRGRSHQQCRVLGKLGLRTVSFMKLVTFFLPIGLVLHDACNDFQSCMNGWHRQDCTHALQRHGNIPCLIWDIQTRQACYEDPHKSSTRPCAFSRFHWRWQFRETCAVSTCCHL